MITHLQGQRKFCSLGKSGRERKRQAWVEMSKKLFLVGFGWCFPPPHSLGECLLEFLKQKFCLSSLLGFCVMLGVAVEGEAGNGRVFLSKERGKKRMGD